MTYGKRILIGLDQFLNTLFMGWPDETLSSRCWRWSKDGVRDWPRKVIDALFFGEQEHCRRSYESERLHLQFPLALRGRSAHDQPEE